MIRMNTESYESRLEEINEHIKKFPLLLGWDAAAAKRWGQLLPRSLPGHAAADAVG